MLDPINPNIALYSVYPSLLKKTKGFFLKSLKKIQAKKV